MYQYQPLQDALEGVADRDVTFTFAEVEGVLGRKLPPSARGKVSRQWWANTESHSQALAWLRNGRKAKLDPSGERVSFVKQSAEGMVSTSSSATPKLFPMTPAARRMVEDYSEERGVDLMEAAATILDRVALSRRRSMLDWFDQNTVFSDISSAELIRQDRDAR